MVAHVLIVANGAFKCGSSWQLDIIRQLVPSERIPGEFQDPEWINPSIDPDRLAAFLSKKYHVERDFVSKNHIRCSPRARLLLDDPHVLVCTLTRDLRDVLVSAYHHDRRVGRTEIEDIEEYYWKMGRQAINRVLRIIIVSGMLGTRASSWARTRPFTPTSMRK